MALPTTAEQKKIVADLIHAAVLYFDISREARYSDVPHWEHAVRRPDFSWLWPKWPPVSLNPRPPHRLFYWGGARGGKEEGR